MKKTIILLMVITITILAGCQEPVNPPDKTTLSENEGELKLMSDEELRSLSQDSSGEGYLKGGERMMEDDVQMSTSSGDAGGTPEYSETNIQEAGVDEADIIKTDGEYIYTISDKTLYIIKAGEDARKISKISLNNTPDALFIDGDNLAVFGRTSSLSDYNIPTTNGLTFFNTYDISDKESPEERENIQIEGQYKEGRMIDGEVYIITTSGPSIKHPRPIIMKDGREEKIDSVYRLPNPYDNPMMSNIHSINIENGEMESKSIVTESTPTVYMSQENIYLAHTESRNKYEIEEEIKREKVVPELNPEDKALIERIKDIEPDILSQAEKERKIDRIINTHVQLMDKEEQEKLRDEIEKEAKEKIEEMEYLENTNIHKIKADDGSLEISGHGKVPGHLNNQFSMDEKDDVLRIATTVNPVHGVKGREEESNHVLTLDEDLEVMDHIKDIAVEESIYSTRFIEDRLYMVTFEQIDPFFVIDLKEPKDLEILGELKITGFSRYLHPYDNETIIGLGKEASETGRTKGLKISLFDVKDVEEPEEITKFVTEDRYASSTAAYEHKAFLFSRDRNLMVIPAYSHGRDDEGYNGAFVFNITKDQIKLRGLIDHSSEKRYGPAVQRSLYIGDNLYTKSENLLRINDLKDLQSVKNITLVDSEKDIPTY
ncbi:MAG: beta-propeller domain-containing protein [Nanobdellota archaeon]